MLEISIFDSGPGFVSTIAQNTNQHISRDRELVALCFEKHSSAKGNKGSGVGLYRILEAVHSLQGFLRVRTSRSEAFFAGSSDYSPDMSPLDFVHDGLAKTEGTSITIGIPIFS